MNSAAGDAERELLAVRERVGRHEAAVAPAVDRDTLGIAAMVFDDMVDGVLEILQLPNAQALVGEAGVCLAAPARAANVDLQDQRAVLRDQLIPRTRAEGVAHGRGVGARVGR